MNCNTNKIIEINRKINKELTPPEALNLALSIITSHAIYLEKREKNSSSIYINKIIEMINDGIEGTIDKIKD